LKDHEERKFRKAVAAMIEVMRATPEAGIWEDLRGVEDPLEVVLPVIRKAASSAESIRAIMSGWRRLCLRTNEMLGVDTGRPGASTRLALVSPGLAGEVIRSFSECGPTVPGSMLRAAGWMGTVGGIAIGGMQSRFASGAADEAMRAKPPACQAHALPLEWLPQMELAVESGRALSRVELPDIQRTVLFGALLSTYGTLRWSSLQHTGGWEIQGEQLGARCYRHKGRGKVRRERDLVVPIASLRPATSASPDPTGWVKAGIEARARVTPKGADFFLPAPVRRFTRSANFAATRPQAQAALQHALTVIGIPKAEAKRVSTYSARRTVPEVTESIGDLSARERESVGQWRPGSTMPQHYGAAGAKQLELAVKFRALSVIRGRLESGKAGTGCGAGEAMAAADDHETAEAAASVPSAPERQQAEQQPGGTSERGAQAEFLTPDGEQAADWELPSEGEEERGRGAHTAGEQPAQGDSEDEALELVINTKTGRTHRASPGTGPPKQGEAPAVACGSWMAARNTRRERAPKAREWAEDPDQLCSACFPGADSGSSSSADSSSDEEGDIGPAGGAARGTERGPSASGSKATAASA